MEKVLNGYGIMRNAIRLVVGFYDNDGMDVHWGADRKG
jgi:hypothetical protein